jgi:hypothetical protein
MVSGDIFSILDRLCQAYPDKRITKGSFKVYMEELEDIPSPLLEQAASYHIRNSTWFPTVSELRMAAQKIAGSPYLGSLLPPGVDSLDLQAQEMENSYFHHHGKFDLQQWEDLARQLERMGRQHRADQLREKAHHIQASQLAEQRGEQYPSPEICHRYAQWEEKTSTHKGD